MIGTASTKSIKRADFDAILFDLDGVVTDTARVHAAAWKRLLDDLLRQRAEESSERFVPFDEERDYLQYVDGKPRHDGAQDFLKSRGIDLPFGDPNDPPGFGTICALANRKNVLFQKQVESGGVEVFDSTICLIESARASGMKTAIISSSRNCERILHAAGIADLFDAKVDGADLDELDMEGKPDPAMFLEAARVLAVRPERAVVIEDAVAGVEAGRKGGFGMVIGINRSDEGEKLIEHGASVVVDDLEDIVIEAARDPWKMRRSDELPSAVAHCDEIFIRLRGKRRVVFLDYDGTLTPIVERPEDALLSDEMREGVRRLAAQCHVAIISGRDLADVRSRVELASVFYAGSHGFEILGPAGFEARHDAGKEFLPLLDEVEEELREAVGAIDGAQVERKRYSIAVHYRRVRDADVGRVEEEVDKVISRHDGLRKTHGKKVFDMQPAIDWHKGRAVEWLMRVLKLDRDTSVAIYIGDDLTDEDAFAALGKDIHGVGIIVAEDASARDTRADYSLRDVDEVAMFLKELAEDMSDEDA